MQVPFFDLTRQNEHLQKDYHDIFDHLLKKGQHVLGQEVIAFEQEFADYTQARHCVTCGNATDALEMALRVMEVGPGHEVIVPTFGWVSLVSAVLNCGATPVFVDVRYDGNIDVQLIQQKITHRTKAIIPIHLYGHPCEIKEIRSICKSQGVSLIEDCAQAHGASVGDIHVGNFGEVGVFSFYPTKNLGALGDGGALITNDENIYHKLRQIRDYGRDGTGDYKLLGRNSRLDEIQAAILRKKLTYLDRWNKRRKEIANQYNQALGVYIETEKSVWYKYVFTTQDRDRIVSKLNSKGIGTGIYYPFQLDKLSFLRSKESPAAMAKRLSETTLSIPLFPEMTKEEISYICQVLSKLEIHSS